MEKKQGSVIIILKQKQKLFQKNKVSGNYLLVFLICIVTCNSIINFSEVSIFLKNFPTKSLANISYTHIFADQTFPENISFNQTVSNSETFEYVQFSIYLYSNNISRLPCIFFKNISESINLLLNNSICKLWGKIPVESNEILLDEVTYLQLFRNIDLDNVNWPIQINSTFQSNYYWNVSQSVWITGVLQFDNDLTITNTIFEYSYNWNQYIPALNQWKIISRNQNQDEFNNQFFLGIIDLGQDLYNSFQSWYSNHSFLIDDDVYTIQGIYTKTFLIHDFNFLSQMDEIPETTEEWNEEIRVDDFNSKIDTLNQLSDFILNLRIILNVILLIIFVLLYSVSLKMSKKEMDQIYMNLTQIGMDKKWIATQFIHDECQKIFFFSLFLGVSLFLNSLCEQVYFIGQMKWNFQLIGLPLLFFVPILPICLKIFRDFIYKTMNIIVKKESFTFPHIGKKNKRPYQRSRTIISASMNVIFLLLLLIPILLPYNSYVGLRSYLIYLMETNGLYSNWILIMELNQLCFFTMIVILPYYIFKFIIPFFEFIYKKTLHYLSPHFAFSYSNKKLISLKSNPVKIVLFGIILYFTIISLGSYNTIQIQQNYEYKTDQIDFGCDMICNQRDEIGFNSLNIMDSNSNIENYCSVGYFITYIDGYRESSIILNFSEYLNVISDSIEEIPNYMQVSNISNRIQTESRESLEAIPIFVSEVFALRYNYELNDSFALYYPLDEYSIQLNCVVEYILTNLPGFNFGEENAASDPISIIIPSLTEINYDNLRFDQKIIMINLFHNDLNSKITTYIDLKESYFFEFLHIKYFNPSETDISLMIYETIAMEFIALTIIMMVLLGFFLKQDLNLYQNKYDKLHLMGVNLIRIKEERKKIQFLELLVFLGVDLSLTVIFIYFFYRFQCLCANFGVNLINPMEPTFWTFYYSTNFPMVVEKVIPFSISPICCLLFLLLGVFYIYSLIQQIREKKYVKSL